MSLDDFGSEAEKHKQISRVRQALRRVSPESEIDVVFEDENEQLKDRPGNVQWTTLVGNSFLGCAKTNKTLKSGVYTITEFKGQPLFVKQDVVVDDLLRFQDSLANKILAEINQFWERGDIFKKYGFLHRRGYLFYGPAGSGKTSIVQQIIYDITKANGIVFLCDHPYWMKEGLRVFREIEPNRPAVCVLEDIDAIISNYGEDKLLSLLDGESQIDKVLNIATTNYPEKLDKRLVARPRRFDRVIKIGMPKKEIRRSYFTEKLKIEESEIAKWVDASEGFSFAAMAELVISVKCLGNDFKDTVKKLKEMMDNKASKFEFGDGQVGFGKTAIDEDEDIL
jgi:AAA+ superfamily predicted ATPase